MAGNALKTPVGKSMNAFTEKKVLDANQLTGKALPCSVLQVSGAIVKVKFEIAAGVWTLPVVKVPIANSLYVREPTQVGDKGYVDAADARLGGVTGMGGGTADLSQPSNLAALVFHPLGNATWPASPNPNALLLQGPAGVIMRDIAGACTWTQTASGVVLKIGGATFTFSASGLVVTGGDVKADTISLKTHLTSQVQSGTGVSGVPVA